MVKDFFNNAPHLWECYVCSVPLSSSAARILSSSVSFFRAESDVERLGSLGDLRWVITVRSGLRFQMSSVVHSLSRSIDVGADRIVLSKPSRRRKISDTNSAMAAL